MVMRRPRVNRRVFAKAQAHSRTAREHLTSSLSESFISLARVGFFLSIFSLVTFQPWIIKSELFDYFFFQH